MPFGRYLRGIEIVLPAKKEKKKREESFDISVAVLVAGHRDTAMPCSLVRELTWAKSTQR